HHVIENADRLEVILSTEEKLEAELLGSDLFMDLAVLQVNSEDIEEVVDIGTSENINVGEPVIAIGNPFSHMCAGYVTQGIINIKGELIGINSMKISQTVAEGIGFAIPIDSALPVIEELENNGEVSRPYLGVELYSLDEVPKSEWDGSLELPEEITKGAYIWSIEPGSPADEAGLKRLDVITEIDGNKIEDIVDLRKILYEKKSIDDEIAITVYREGEKIETTAILIEQE